MELRRHRHKLVQRLLATLETFFWSPFKTFRDKVLECARVILFEFCNLPVENLPEGLEARLKLLPPLRIIPVDFAGKIFSRLQHAEARRKHFQKDDAHTVNICREGNRMLCSAILLFGSRIAKRTNRTDVQIPKVRLACKAKIKQDGHSVIRAHNNVRRLQVAVDNALIVQFNKPFQNSANNGLTPSGISFVYACFNLLFEVITLVVLHDQKGTALRILAHEFSMSQMTTPGTVFAGNQSLVAKKNNLVRVGISLDTLNQDLLFRRLLLQPRRRYNAHGALVSEDFFAPQRMAVSLVIYQSKGARTGLTLR